MNPVRAKMVNHPAEYRWSSYRVNAQSERSQIITPHAQYLALGGQDGRAANAYRELFKNDLESELVDRFVTRPMEIIFLAFRSLLLMSRQ